MRAGPPIAWLSCVPGVGKVGVLLRQGRQLVCRAASCGERPYGDALRDALLRLRGLCTSTDGDASTVTFRPPPPRQSSSPCSGALLLPRHEALRSYFSNFFAWGEKHGLTSAIASCWTQSETDVFGSAQMTHRRVVRLGRASDRRRSSAEGRPRRTATRRRARAGTARSQVVAVDELRTCSASIAPSPRARAPARPARATRRRTLG